MKLYPVWFLATAALLCVFAPQPKAVASNSQNVKAGLLADIAFEYAELDDAEQVSAVAEQALQAIAAMEFPCYKATSLARVGGSYWLVGNNVKGKQLMAEAIQTAIAQEKTGCSMSSTSPAESLMYLGQEYAEDGHFDFAIALSHNGAPQTVIEIALALLEAGQTQQANRLLNEAIASTQKIESPESQDRFASNLNYVASRLKATGHPELRLRVLEEAATRAEKRISQPPETALMQFSPRLETVRGLADAGAKERAIALLDKMMPALLELPDIPALTKLDLVTDAASLHQQIGLTERAASLFARAEQMARDLTANEKVMGLSRVVRGYAEAGNFDRAMELARTAQPAREQANIFQSIALVRSSAGDSEGVMKMAQGSTDPQMRILAIHHYLAQKQPDKALALQQAYNIKDMRLETALGFLEAGQPDKALAIVRSESLPGFTPNTVQSDSQNGLPERARQPVRGEEFKGLLPSVARGFAQQKQFEKAVEIAQSIAEPVNRAKALIEIASVWGDRDARGISNGKMGVFQRWLTSIFGRAESSERDRAAQMLKQALEITNSLPSGN